MGLRKEVICLLVEKLVKQVYKSKLVNQTFISMLFVMFVSIQLLIFF